MKHVQTSCKNRVKNSFRKHSSCSGRKYVQSSVEKHVQRSGRTHVQMKHVQSLTRTHVSRSAITYATNVSRTHTLNPCPNTSPKFSQNTYRNLRCFNTCLELHQNTWLKPKAQSRNMSKFSQNKCPKVTQNNSPCSVRTRALSSAGIMSKAQSWNLSKGHKTCHQLKHVPSSANKTNSNLSQRKSKSQAKKQQSSARTHIPSSFRKHVSNSARTHVQSSVENTELKLEQNICLFSQKTCPKLSHETRQHFSQE